MNKGEETNEMEYSATSTISATKTVQPHNTSSGIRAWRSSWGKPTEREELGEAH
jgi:hypothetical protein